MKRRDQGMLSSSSSSTSRRISSPENNQPKNIGCMSGIFHLVSKYSHRRKFITSGKKQERSVIASQVEQIPAENEAHDQVKLITEKTASLDLDQLQRFSCDVQRSPTIPSEIRRSSSVDSASQLHRSPALVAKLMGLNDLTTDHQSSSPRVSTAADKRRKLLEALEKCDEDLKSLKKIIEAVRSCSHLRSSSPAAEANDGESKGQDISPRPKILANRQCSSEDEVASTKDHKVCSSSSDEIDGGDSITNERKCSDFSSDRPSPVSVLEEISSPPPLSCRGSNLLQKAGLIKNRKQRDEEGTNLSFFHRLTIESLPRFYYTSRGEYLMSSTITPMKTNWASSYWNSKAKVESIMEVCEEAIWEERWELERVGMILQDYMLGDLIEETVKELAGYCHHQIYYALPFEVCKRKLYF